MKLIGELKDKVEKAENQEEAKKIIKDAGMELTDEEMDQVTGGIGEGPTPPRRKYSY
ncbi:MAG: bacteriocin [Lachnospiraceae bacterium]|nr:bacteriocin [Lachnospiraceae bacterium]